MYMVGIQYTHWMIPPFTLTHWFVCMVHTLYTLCLHYMTHLKAQRENIFTSQRQAVPDKVTALNTSAHVQDLLRICSWDAAMIPHLSGEVCHGWFSDSSAMLCSFRETHHKYYTHRWNSKQVDIYLFLNSCIAQIVSTISTARDYSPAFLSIHTYMSGLLSSSKLDGLWAALWRLSTCAICRNVTWLSREGLTPANHSAVCTLFKLTVNCVRLPEAPEELLHRATED